MTDCKKLVPGILILVALVSAFWWPALIGGKTMIHGDSPGHGLPLLDLQSRSLSDLGRLLWSNEIYGGHALFAESQGGFANPVNIAFAWLVAPLAGAIYAENAFHWFCMLGMGAGILLLCRKVGLGSWASCLGAVAAALALDTIGIAQNLTISAALLWAPWAILAMENWLASPTAGAALLLGTSIALELFSGYPQVLDGVLLYMTAMMLARLADQGARHIWIDAWRRRLGTLALAVLAAVGLGAVQLLPTIELVGQSHRSGGIPIPLQLPFAAYVRGFLFTREIAGSAQYFPFVGSLLVCVLASAAAILPRPPAVKGHIAGTAVLIFLGLGRCTWLFRMIYDHHLLPQLHYYRHVLVYMNVACLTSGVLAAAGADGFARWAVDLTSRPRSISRSIHARTALLALFALLWFWVAWRFWLPGVHSIQVAVVVVGIAGGATLAALRSSARIPMLLASLLVVETIAVRLDNFPFLDTSLFDKPSSITAIQATPDWRDYKIFSQSLVGGFGLVPPDSPELQAHFKRMFPSAAGLSNLIWGIPSMDGALALELRRRDAVSRLLDDEAYGRTQSPPGSRLMDMLGIRWVVFDAHPVGSSYRTFWHEDPDSVWIMENPAARPRFQLFAGCRSVSSLTEAVSSVGALPIPALVVERGETQSPCQSKSDPSALSASGFQVLKAKSTRYHLRVNASAPLWLFLADANYPGWRAYVDGAETPVYSANVLGKAIAIPRGKHDVWIRFQSRSFEWGAAITLATIAAIGVAGAVAYRPKRAR